MLTMVVVVLVSNVIWIGQKVKSQFKIKNWLLPPNNRNLKLTIAGRFLTSGNWL